MRSTARSYYNALLASGRVRQLSLTEAQRDLSSVDIPLTVPPVFNF
jgi:hypothetical protein